VGAFLAVPLTNMVQVALSSSPQTRKWALLLSNYKGEDEKRKV
jgi:predicted PurR-regulated permease PerM